MVALVNDNASHERTASVEGLRGWSLDHVEIMGILVLRTSQRRGWPLTVRVPAGGYFTALPGYLTVQCWAVPGCQGMHVVPENRICYFSVSCVGLSSGETKKIVGCS